VNYFHPSYPFVQLTPRAELSSLGSCRVLRRDSLIGMEQEY